MPFPTDTKRMNNSNLEQASYVSLVTYRKSGKEVATPVWAACENGTYYVFSAGSAGKVKRLRNSDRAKIAKCDLRGKLLGDWHSGKAVLIDEPAEIAQALQALRKKYGFQMWLSDLGAKLTGRFQRRAYISFVLSEEA